MKYRIAIIGPENVTSLFKSVGADVFVAHTGEEATDALKEIKASTDDPESTKRYAVALILESLYTALKEEDLQKLSRGSLPSIISVPGLEGSSGAALQKLGRLAEQAVGSNILN